MEDDGCCSKDPVSDGMSSASGEGSGTWGSGACASSIAGGSGTNFRYEDWVSGSGASRYVYIRETQNPWQREGAHLVYSIDYTI